MWDSEKCGNRRDVNRVSDGLNLAVGKTHGNGSKISTRRVATGDDRMTIQSSLRDGGVG